MIVMKFGGSSLANAGRLLHVSFIVSNAVKREKVLVIASAMYGVTDRLIDLFDKYKSGNLSEAKVVAKEIYDKHIDTLENLNLSQKQYKKSKKWINEFFDKLFFFLSITNEYSPMAYDYVISSGEKLSCFLLSESLRKIHVKSTFLDSSKIIVATKDFGNAKVIFSETVKKAKSSILPKIYNGSLPVVTGFFGATQNGKIVTLGRGGSDYSATILANALDAEKVILWKEVDGVYSGDPKKDPNVRLFKKLSYEQAINLAKHGAKVLHPEAMKPVWQKAIPVWVKNTFKPDLPGTVISNSKENIL